jgi:hypothetical protein
MSSTSQIELRRYLETVYGDPPSPAEAGSVVRRTGGQFAQSTTAESSAEVRKDLQTTDIYRTDVETTATIEDEWVYGAHAEELADVFGNPWSTPLNISASTISFDTTDDSINDSANGFGAVVDGQPIVIGGSVPGNNIRCRVTKVSAGKLIANRNLTTAAAGATITIKGSYLRLGTTPRSVTFEEEHSGISPAEYWPYVGCMAESWVYQFQHPGKMTTTFTYKGKSVKAGHTFTDSVGTNSPVAYAANPVMNSADHWMAPYEGGAASTLRVKEFQITVSAPKRRILAAGTLGNADMGLNTYVITGQVVIYNSAAGRALAQKHLNFTETSWEFDTVDSLGNAMTIYLPRLHYNGGTPSSGPKDGDSLITLPFMAKRSSTIASMIQLGAFPIA